VLDWCKKQYLNRDGLGGLLTIENGAKIFPIRVKGFDGRGTLHLLSLALDDAIRIRRWKKKYHKF